MPPKSLSNPCPLFHPQGHSVVIWTLPYLPSAFFFKEKQEVWIFFCKIWYSKLTTDLLKKNVQAKWNIAACFWFLDERQIWIASPDLDGAQLQIYHYLLLSLWGCSADIPCLLNEWTNQFYSASKKLVVKKSVIGLFN